MSHRDKAVRGLWMTFAALWMVFLIGGVLLILDDLPWLGGVLVLATLVALFHLHRYLVKLERAGQLWPDDR